MSGNTWSCPNCGSVNSKGGLFDKLKANTLGRLGLGGQSDIGFTVQLPCPKCGHSSRVSNPPKQRHAGSAEIERFDYLVREENKYAGIDLHYFFKALHAAAHPGDPPEYKTPSMAAVCRFLEEKPKQWRPTQNEIETIRKVLENPRSEFQRPA